MFPTIKAAIALVIFLAITKIVLLSSIHTLGFTESPIVVHSLTIILATMILMAIAKVANRQQVKPQLNALPLNQFLLIALLSNVVLFGFHILLSNYLNYIAHHKYQTLYTPNTTTLPINYGSLLIVCFIAPISEELIYRGVILKGLVQHHGAKTSILVSALLFSLAHLNIEQFLPKLMAGCFFGWIYIRSRSITLVIMTHISYNSIAFWIENTSTKLLGINYFPSYKLIFAPIEWQLIATIAIAVGIFFIKKTLFRQGRK